MLIEETLKNDTDCGNLFRLSDSADIDEDAFYHRCCDHCLRHLPNMQNVFSATRTDQNIRSFAVNNSAIDRVSWIKSYRADEIMRRHAGFSLIELMVAIAIFAILASIAMPPLLRWRTDAKLRGAASNLRGDLELAKVRAIRENSFVAVLFRANGYTIFVDNGASAGDWIEDADERQLRNKQLPAGVNIIMPTSFTNNQTRFTGRGMAEITGTVVIENIRGNQLQISINRLGRIRLQ